MSIRLFSILALLVTGVLTGSAFAALEQAPPNFPYRGGSDAIFVDFLTADYHVTYDVSKSLATVESEIVFEMPKSGYPIFDLVSEPTSLTLDGATAPQELISDPDGVSKFRIVKTVTSPGRHTLKISHRLTDTVSFKSGGVSSAFWTSDLDDRQYLEQYLPASFEYDQVEEHLAIDIVGADSVPHVVRANGVVKSVGTNRFTIDFPKFFTASSMFFHVMPEKSFKSKSFDFKSSDGRTIPVEIYTTYEPDSFATEVVSALTELEKDYGPFPHPKVVVYGTGRFTGGMEYSGATMSSLDAIGHELFHSYNARSVMPANGNAGWMDEAMSSWRDHGYDLLTEPGFKSTKMAGHSIWTRMTDDKAYDEGAWFLAYVANSMKAKGEDLKVFLRDYYARHRETTVTTEVLRDDLISLTGLDLSKDFDQYIYGKTVATPPTRDGDGSKGSSWPHVAACGEPATKAVRRENPYHPRMTKAQLNALLWP